MQCIIMACFLKDVSNPFPSNQKKNLEVVVLLLDFLCVIKRKIEWLFKNSPSPSRFDIMIVQS